MSRSSSRYSWGLRLDSNGEARHGKARHGTARRGSARRGGDVFDELVRDKRRRFERIGIIMTDAVRRRSVLARIVNFDTLPRNIKALREMAGLSQRQAADKLGFRSAATLSHYENGQRRLPIEVLVKMADIYGVKISMIIEVASPSPDNGEATGGK